jgi:signal transduction histidine kinase
MQPGKDANRGAVAATFIVNILSELRRVTNEVEDAQNTLPRAMKALPPNLQEMLGKALKHLRRAAEIMNAVAAFIEDEIGNDEMLATIAVTMAERMIDEAKELAENGDVVMAREKLMGAMAIKELGDTVPWLEWKINDLMNRIKQLLEQLQTTDAPPQRD